VLPESAPECERCSRRRNKTLPDRPTYGQRAHEVAKLTIWAGAMLPSDIRRRMNSHSRKNRLYFALRELGRVVRTWFLLQCLANLQLRHQIQTATTKSERFHQFVPFGHQDYLLLAVPFGMGEALIKL
jgi:hypothetical protein